MLPLSLVALGLAIIGAYAKPTVRPGGGLELSLSTPANKVAPAFDLRVDATVRKDGKEDPFIGTTYPTPADGLSKREYTISKSCTSPRDGEVKASIEVARTLASHAIEYIKRSGADSLYKAYFGDNPTDEVINKFGFIVAASAHKKAECYCDSRAVLLGVSDPDVYNVAGSDDIHFCEPFFNQKNIDALCRNEVSPTAKNLRGGSALRMLARAYVPGVAGEHRTCEQSKGLSDFDKITNNDNYECFATEAFVTIC